MGVTKQFAPGTRPRLVRSLVDATPEVLARESTAHADAIARLERQVGTVEDGGAAGGVPSSRVLTTTAPLTIDGGASASLAADRTLAVVTFGTAARGVVPASGGGTANFLRADGAWAPPIVDEFDTIIDMTGTPISFGAVYDNWNVGALGRKTLIKYITDGAPSGTSSRAVRGLAGGSAGMRITLMNMAPNLTGLGVFQHEDGAASAGNQFHNAGGVAMSGGTMGCVTYWHDGAIWRHTGGTQ